MSFLFAYTGQLRLTDRGTPIFNDSPHLTITDARPRLHLGSDRQFPISRALGAPDDFLGFSQGVQTLLEGLLRPVCFENTVAVVVPVDHMKRPFVRLGMATDEAAESQPGPFPAACCATVFAIHRAQPRAKIFTLKHVYVLLLTFDPFGATPLALS